MSLFKKKIEFISAICPECKGNLQVDTTLTKAYCQYCGAQCIIENAPKKKEKKRDLELLIDYVERRQAIKRQEKKEREQKEEENSRKQRAYFKKYWWVYFIGAILLYGLIFAMAILENQGIL